MKNSMLEIVGRFLVFFGLTATKFFVLTFAFLFGQQSARVQLKCERNYLEITAKQRSKLRQ